MAETRKARIDHIFRCTSKRGDERKAVGFARWKERQEKNFASVISLANKFKLLFHSRPVSQSKAASKEVQKPGFQTQEPSNLPRGSLKKPPFIVPGKIHHNDRHLLQAVPQVKNPPKKNLPTKPSIKPATTQWGTSRQASSKIRSATALAKASSGSVADSCPQCKGFVPPAGIKVPEESSTSLVQETDYQPASSLKPFPKNFPCSYKPNPWIIVDRRTSVQKPFNSLLSSQESSAPQASAFFEDVTHLESEEEDSDYEPKSFNDMKIRRSNEDEDAVKNDFEPNIVNCNIKVEVVVHSDVSDHVNKNGSTDEIGSATLSEVDESPKPERAEIAQQLRAEMSKKKTYLDGLCHLWSGVLEEGDCIPQDEVGSILTVLGQTQQLQRERFHQYATLILQFEQNTAEKTITETDLEGFWEMISLQVTDVENKFFQLDSLRKAGWKRQENVESCRKKKINPKRRPEKITGAVKSEMKSSEVRSHIAALRKKQIRLPTSGTDNPVAFLDRQPSPMIILSRLNIESNGVSQLKQSGSEGDIIQQTGSCQSVILPTNVGCYTTNNSTPETVQQDNQLRERKKHMSASNAGFFSSPHQSNISRLRSHTTDCKVDQPSVPSPSIVLVPGSSTPSKDYAQTPECVKVLRVERKKHNSAISIGYFSSPHLIDSPRLRSRSTECMLDQHRLPSSSVERMKMPTFNQLPSHPTVRQLVTRSGRVSQSPVRFGQKETISPWSLRSTCSEYTKPQRENIDASSEVADHLSPNKEENNNENNFMNDGLPTTSS